MKQAAEIKQELARWIDLYKKDAAGHISEEFAAASSKKTDCEDHPAMLFIPEKPAYPVCSACQKQPAIELEEKTGLKNIAGHYKLPQALTNPDIENYAMITLNMVLGGSLAEKDGLRKLQKIWDVLKELNPELETVKPERNALMQVYDAVLGVASAFNVSDIHEYIHVGSGRIRNSSPDYKRKARRIERVTGHFGWIPGSKTLENMERQLIAQNKLWPPNTKPPRFEP